MTSKIANAIRLSTQPIAIYRASEAPEGALTFKPDVWACSVALLKAAARGKTAACSKDTISCNGGKTGMGVGCFQPGFIENFLSNVKVGPKEPEHYKKSPAHALDYVNSLPQEPIAPAWVVFQPLDQVPEGVRPETVVFLANADQLSGLVTLAHYDNADRDNIQVKFGAGCAQMVLFGLQESDKGSKTCTIGLTDPSARKVMDRDVLSFSIPYGRFLELEGYVEECFFQTETWQVIADRIHK